MVCPLCLQYECENVLADSALLDACGTGLGRQEMYGAMLACKRIGEDPKLGVATVRFFGKVGRRAPGAGHLMHILLAPIVLTTPADSPPLCCSSPAAHVCHQWPDSKLYGLTLPYQPSALSQSQQVLQLPCFTRQACSQAAGVERLSAGPWHSPLLVMLGFSQPANLLQLPLLQLMSTGAVRFQTVGAELCTGRHPTAHLPAAGARHLCRLLRV